VNAPEVIISTGISYHALPYRLLTQTENNDPHSDFVALLNE
jgi:hypothetical protein